MNSNELYLTQLSVKAGALQLPKSAFFLNNWRETVFPREPKKYIDLPERKLTKLIMTLELPDDSDEALIAPQILLAEGRKIISTGIVQQHFRYVRIVNGIAVGEMVTAILCREGVEVLLLPSDCDHSYFIHERKVALSKARLDVHFADVPCHGVCIKDIGAVKIVQCADFYQHVLKNAVQRAELLEE